MLDTLGWNLSIYFQIWTRECWNWTCLCRNIQKCWSNCTLRIYVSWSRIGNFCSLFCLQYAKLLKMNCPLLIYINCLRIGKNLNTRNWNFGISLTWWFSQRDFMRKLKEISENLLDFVWREKHRRNWGGNQLDFAWGRSLICVGL